jgi:hypothetical protein
MAKRSHRLGRLSAGVLKALGSAQFAGLVFGLVLLAWAALATIAPGLAAMLAVFGSPVLACAILLRILTLRSAGSQR